MPGALRATRNRRRVEAPPSVSTARFQATLISTVRTFLAYLVRAGYLLGSLGDALELPRLASHLPPGGPTRKEAERLLAADTSTVLGLRDRAYPVRPVLRCSFSPGTAKAPSRSRSERPHRPLRPRRRHPEAHHSPHAAPLLRNPHAQGRLRHPLHPVPPGTRIPFDHPASDPRRHLGPRPRPCPLPPTLLPRGKPTPAADRYTRGRSPWAARAGQRRYRPGGSLEHRRIMS